MGYKYKYDGEEEKRVETLTLDIIRKELLKYTFLKLRLTLICIALLALLLCLGFSMLKYRTDFELIFELLGYAVFAIFIIAECVLITKAFLSVSLNKIKVVTDDLVDLKETDSFFRITQYYKPRYSYDYYLYFRRYGKYIIPYENYKWSKLFKMTDEGVYNFSNLGDTFYVVIVGKNEIGLVYNCKLFKYEGETDS